MPLLVSILNIDVNKLKNSDLEFKYSDKIAMQQILKTLQDKKRALVLKKQQYDDQYQFVDKVINSGLTSLVHNVDIKGRKI